jgi:tyrosyl-tRNA synthetase
LRHFTLSGSLASEVVARYHGRDAASAAREFFERTVQRKEIPTENLDEIEIGDCKRVTDVLVKAGFAQSRREAERLIAGNAVKIDGELTKDQKQLWTASEPAVLSVGSRRFIRVLPSPLSPQ